MRKFSLLLGAILALGLALATNRAEAGSTSYYICHIGKSGSECLNLPSNYSLPGVRKPACDAVSCYGGTVDFRLTPKLIKALKRFVNTANMVPGGMATIYAPDK